MQIAGRDLGKIGMKKRDMRKMLYCHVAYTVLALMTSLQMQMQMQMTSIVL